MCLILAKLQHDLLPNYCLKANDNSNMELINEALEASSTHTSINTQLRTAKRYLKSTENSDYRNAIKEAIGAVESTLRIVLKDEKITVGEALKKNRQRD